MNSFNSTTETSTSSCPLASDGKGSPVSVDATNNNATWEVGSDVFSFCTGMSPVDDTQAGMSSVQSGLDGHLPPLQAPQHSTQDRVMLDLSSPTSYFDGGSLEYSDNDGNNAGPLFERRKRSRSNSSRHRFSDVVAELSPEEVRWFYKEDKKTWKPFVGHDSLKIEIMFRKYCELNSGIVASQVSCGDQECSNNGVERSVNGSVPVETRTSSVLAGQGSMEASTSSSDERDLDCFEINVEPVCVRGGLYEVDIKERECKPVYWKRE